MNIDMRYFINLLLIILAAPLHAGEINNPREFLPYEKHWISANKQITGFTSVELWPTELPQVIELEPFSDDPDQTITVIVLNVWCNNNYDEAVINSFRNDYLKLRPLQGSATWGWGSAGVVYCGGDPIGELKGGRIFYDGDCKLLNNNGMTLSSAMVQAGYCNRLDMFNFSEEFTRRLKDFTNY